MGVPWSWSPVVLITFFSTTRLGSFLFSWSSTMSVWTRESLLPLVPTLRSICDLTLRLCLRLFRWLLGSPGFRFQCELWQENMFRIGTEEQRLSMQVVTGSICLFERCPTFSLSHSL